MKLKTKDLLYMEKSLGDLISNENLSDWVSVKTYYWIVRFSNEIISKLKDYYIVRQSILKKALKENELKAEDLSKPENKELNDKIIDEIEQLSDEEVNIEFDKIKIDLGEIKRKGGKIPAITWVNLDKIVEIVGFEEEEKKSKKDKEVKEED